MVVARLGAGGQFLAEQFVTKCAHWKHTTWRKIHIQVRVPPNSSEHFQREHTANQENVHTCTCLYTQFMWHHCKLNMIKKKKRKKKKLKKLYTAKPRDFLHFLIQGPCSYSHTHFLVSLDSSFLEENISWNERLFVFYRKTHTALPGRTNRFANFCRSSSVHPSP